MGGFENVGLTMRSLPEPILSADLKPSDLPEVHHWSDIIDFAATFSPQLECRDESRIRGLTDLREHSTVAEIRAAIFFEYRRYNHFGYPPSEHVLENAKQAVSTIRRKLR
jgi:hypothetical protein